MRKILLEVSNFGRKQQKQHEITTNHSRSPSLSPSLTQICHKSNNGGIETNHVQNQKKNANNKKIETQHLNCDKTLHHFNFNSNNNCHYYRSPFSLCDCQLKQNNNVTCHHIIEYYKGIFFCFFCFFVF